MPKSLRTNRVLAVNTAALALRLALATNLAAASLAADTLSAPLAIAAAAHALAVFAGLLTRVVALSGAALILLPGPSNVCGAPLVVAVAGALALSGAGQWSLDRILFHRRVYEWSDRS